MHFGDIVKLAKNGQYFISRILLHEAEVSLAFFLEFRNMVSGVFRSLQSANLNQK